MIRIREFMSDTAVLSGRMLRHNIRSVDTIITVAAIPVIMMLMTVYVFGGAMDTSAFAGSGAASYINYVVPGIVLMTIASGVAYAAFRLNSDVTAGIFDRFHSMPVARSAVLGGHVASSVVVSAVSTLLVLLFALLIGFRTDAGFGGWLLASGFMLLLTLALTWVAVLFGLLARSAEGAGVFSYLLLIMIFISSAFAPTDTMPPVLRAFAENQPFTSIANTLRTLLMGASAGSEALVALLWSVGILALFYVGAIAIYKRRRH